MAHPDDIRSWLHSLEEEERARQECIDAFGAERVMSCVWLALYSKGMSCRRRMGMAWIPL